MRRARRRERRVEKDEALPALLGDVVEQQRSGEGRSKAG